MTRFLIVALPVVMGLGLIKCNSNSKPSTRDSSTGVYQYSGYDQAGKKIVEGQLEITSVEGDRVKGKWQLKAIGKADNIGPQVGAGDFEGEFNQGELRLNLNPKMADNNVTLAGKIEGSRFHGTWSFSGFAGVISRGTFEARKK